MHLVLEPRAMPHDLVAPRHQPTLAFRLRVRRPDLRQVPSRLQTGERAGIDLVGLDVSLGDRLHLQRIGDNHPCHERCQNPRYRHAVAGCFDHHLITGQQGLAKSLQRSPRHINAARMSEPAILPNHHLPESSVDVDARSETDTHLLHIRASILDYAIVGYAIECLDTNAAARARSDIIARCLRLHQMWHVSAKAMTTDWNRCLSLFQPFGHAEHVLSAGNEDWLCKTKNYLPGATQTDYFKVKYRMS